MFCFQCQETAGNKGCRFTEGICGKNADTAELMDLLIYLLKGISVVAEGNKIEKVLGRFLTESMFMTITNANFSNERLLRQIKAAFVIRNSLVKRYGLKPDVPECATWFSDKDEKLYTKAKEVGVLTTSDEDIRSLRELIIYGIKGISAYAHHAEVLGFENDSIYSFLIKGLAATTKNLTTDELVVCS